MPDSIYGLGIDQGIANCGYAVVELTPNDELRVLTSGTILTTTNKELSKRVEVIYNMINKMVEDYNIKILGCEALFFSPKQKSDTNKGGRNKSASILYTNMATGVLYLLAGQHDIHLKQFVPGTVKKFVTGSGRASKDEVLEGVLRLVNTEHEIKTEHEGDAIAIGITAVKFKRELELKGLEREPKKEKPKKKEKTKKEKAKKEKTILVGDHPEEIKKTPKSKTSKKKGESVA